MRKLILAGAVALAALVGGCATASRAGLVVSSVTLAADWRATRWAVQQGGTYTEHNPIMGSSPSTSTVDAYMVGCLAVNAAAYEFLPGWARPLWYLGVTAVEISAVHNNVANGTPW